MVPILGRLLREYTIQKNYDTEEEDERITILVTLQRLEEKIPGCGADEVIHHIIDFDKKLKKAFEMTLKSENALLQMNRMQCEKEAEDAFMKKDYSRVVAILSSFESSLQPVLLKKLQIARKYMKK